MARLSVELSDERLSALERYAAESGTPVSSIIEQYVAYLLAGGAPVPDWGADELTAEQLTALVQHGGSFDWLADEPDIYTENDGDPV